MAASEHKAEAFVGDLLTIKTGLFEAGGTCRKQRLDFFFKMSAAAQSVNGFVPCGLNDPGAWRIRDARDRPFVQGGGECLLRIVLGQIEIFEEVISVARIRPQSERYTASTAANASADTA
jgi:hypothetical protein